MKKCIALGAVAAITLSVLSGCVDSDNGQSSSSDTATSASDREHVEVTMLLVSPNCNESELDKIAEKASEITEEKFNTTLNLITVTPTDYTNKMNMMLAAGDTLDIFQGFEMYDQYVAQNYIMPIEEFEQYYQDALEIVGDDIKVAQNNGHTYGIPITNFGASGGDAYGIRSDIVEELGIKLDEIKNWEDFADVLRQIKAAYPDVTPLMGGANEPAINMIVDMSTGIYPDMMGNNASLVVINDPMNNSTVTARVKTEGFKMACDYAWELGQEGLIGYDEVSQPSDLVKAGKSVVARTMNGYSPEETLKEYTGYDMDIWLPTEEPCVTFTNNVWTWCITDYCENPERALEVLNEFYINPDLANLLEWGIEGEHYRVVDEEKGLVDFLEGQNMGNVSYYNYIKDNIPNSHITYIGVNENQEKWTLTEKFKESQTIRSPYLGFVFDQSAVQNQIAACTNVIDKYCIGLLSGQLDPSTEYDKMIQELEIAGIDEIVAEAQAQLDEWIEQNK